MRHALNLDRMNDLTDPLAEFSEDESVDHGDGRRLPPPPDEPAPNTAPATSSAEASPSALLKESRRLGDGASPASLLADLRWQRDVDGDNTKVKAFRFETLQSLDLRVFAYMRPASPFIQLFHSAATFYTPGGDTDYRGRDIGFIGDRTDLQSPTTVVLAPESPWKWVTRKVVMDEVALELFYADPGNRRKLWQPTVRTAEENRTMPKLLFLPPQLIPFCSASPRTPYELMTEVIRFASGRDITDYAFLIDWALMASHADGVATTTSILAFTMEAAVSSDVLFHRWVKRRLDGTLGPPVEAQPIPQAMFHNPPPQQPAPPPDV